MAELARVATSEFQWRLLLPSKTEIELALCSWREIKPPCCAFDVALSGTRRVLGL